MNTEDWKFWKPASAYKAYWQNYVASFKTTESSPKYTVFDCETTGLNPSKDVILSVGGIQLKNNRIYIRNSFEFFLSQTYFDEASVKIHGIVKQSKDISYFSEEEAIIHFLAIVKNSILVGHQVGFDIAMINQALNRLGLPSLKNKSIDTNVLFQQKNHLPNDVVFSLDELCEKFSLPKKARHTALGDAFLTAQIFQRLQAI